MHVAHVHYRYVYYRCDMPCPNTRPRWHIKRHTHTHTSHPYDLIADADAGVAYSSRVHAALLMLPAY